MEQDKKIYQAVTYQILGFHIFMRIVNATICELTMNDFSAVCNINPFKQTSSGSVPLLSSNGCWEWGILRKNIPVRHQFPAGPLLWTDAGGTGGFCSHQALKGRGRQRRGSERLFNGPCGPALQSTV